MPHLPLPTPPPPPPNINWLHIISKHVLFLCFTRKMFAFIYNNPLGRGSVVDGYIKRCSCDGHRKDVNFLELH